MVSSTYTDLKEHREALIMALHKHKLHANVMEHDDAKVSHDVIESSLQMVRDSAAYIVLVSQKYGQTPEDTDRNPDKLSITELEFNEAQRLNRPILLFIMGDDHHVKKSDIEPNRTKGKKLKAFRDRAKRASPGGKVHRVYAVFNSLEEFKDKLGSSLFDLCQLLDSNERQATVPAIPSANTDAQSIPKVPARPGTRTGSARVRSTSRAKAKSQSPGESDTVSKKNVKGAEAAVEKLRADAVDCLMKSKDAAEILAAQLSVTVEYPEREDYLQRLCNLVVDNLIKKDAAPEAIIALIQAYNAASKRHGGRKADSSSTIEELLYHLLPVIYKPHDIQEVRADVLSGGSLVPLPANSETIAELVMAGVDARPAKFEWPREKTTNPPVGAYNIRNHTPEEGKDPTGELFIDNFLYNLAALHLPPGSPIDTRNDLVKSVSNFLKDTLAIDQFRYYYVYTIPTPAVAGYRRKLMAELQKLLPDLVFLQMAKPSDPHLETRIVTLLNNIIHKSAGFE
jgi:hypothetical protein